MADLPIPFTAPMILALLAGRKTMTRRVLTRLREKGAISEFGRSSTPGYHWTFRDAQKRWHDARHDRMLQLLPWQIGDRLWVRETYHQFGHWEEMPGRATKQGRVKWRFVADDPEIRFDAPDEYRKGRHHDDPYTPAWHKRLGRFMPRRASRLTLIVEAVKVERLQDISKEDALAEGVEFETADPPFYYVPGIHPHSITAVGVEEPSAGSPLAVRSYAKLWAHINGADAWTANPWIAAIRFRVIKSNIDALDLVNRPLCECSMTCGFLSSHRPSEERCNACGAVSDRFGEFCSCGAQDFSHVCPECGADVVVDHPDTIGPHNRASAKR